MSFHPQDAAVSMNPPELAASGSAAREDGGGFLRRALLVVRMNDSEPEVRHRHPLVGLVPQHGPRMIADVANALRVGVRLTPRLPHHAGDVRDHLEEAL